MKNDLEREVEPLIGQWTGHLSLSKWFAQHSIRDRAIGRYAFGLIFILLLGCAKPVEIDDNTLKSIHKLELVVMDNSPAIREPISEGSLNKPYLKCELKNFDYKLLNDIYSNLSLNKNKDKINDYRIGLYAYSKNGLIIRLLIKNKSHYSGGVDGKLNDSEINASNEFPNLILKMALNAQIKNKNYESNENNEVCNIILGRLKYYI
jgi:hypothetical protein